jgi:CheY-like chemotaxis protein
MRDVNVERVLLVEQPNGRDMLKLGLEAAGFETDVADDAEAALSAAMAHARASLGGARSQRTKSRLARASSRTIRRT